jgi:uncharacterized C2H2 Zn-finger protein
VSACPYCGAIAEDAWAEIAHMEAAHPDVLRQRGVATITCPRCGMTSANPNDVREGYCGNCHAFTGARA